MTTMTAKVVGKNARANQINLDATLPELSEGDQTVIALDLLPDVKEGEIIEIQIENGLVVEARHTSSPKRTSHEPTIA